MNIFKRIKLKLFGKKQSYDPHIPPASIQRSFDYNLLSVPVPNFIKDGDHQKVSRYNSKRRLELEKQNKRIISIKEKYKGKLYSFYVGLNKAFIVRFLDFLFDVYCLRIGFSRRFSFLWCFKIPIPSRYKLWGLIENYYIKRYKRETPQAEIALWRKKRGKEIAKESPDGWAKALSRMPRVGTTLCMRKFNENKP